MPTNDQIRRSTHSPAASKPDSPSHSPGTGNTEASGLEVVDDDELRDILADNQDSGPIGRPSDVTLNPPEADNEPESDLDELSLVSTQALQKLLVGDQKKPELKPVENAGFNPYDKNDGATDSDEKA